MLKSKRGTRVFIRNARNNLASSKRSHSRFDFKISENLVKSKRSQITIFVIIAIIIVAAAVLLIVFRKQIIPETIPEEFKPIEANFLSCIEEYTKIGAEMLGEHAGYISMPEFEPGSEYAPTSSQLDFLGSPVPYWYYVSGNNILKEQAPSKREMERQLEQFLEDNLACDFSSFREQGFDIRIEALNADIDINNLDIGIEMRGDLIASFGEDTVTISKHKTSARSKLGKFYELAKKIYNYEKEEMFLEKYGVDVMRLYAPVDGVELTCSPKIWMLDEVYEDLLNGIEANTQTIKLKGNYYELKEDTRKYFVQDISTDEQVSFLYSKSWPTKIEVEPAEEGFLIAEPVGLQEGLGVMGFCYVPYHYVYDISYPVLIQIYDEDELFQFPVVVVIDNNVPRQSLVVDTYGDVEVKLCEYKNQKVRVETFDNRLEGVEADISFKCFNEECQIGRTKQEGQGTILTAYFPQCVNGFIIAKADGYKTEKHLISTTSENYADILLDKEYEIEIDLKLNGKAVGDMAIINFLSDEAESRSVAWPEQKKIKLTEGQYAIEVYIYGETDMSLESFSQEKCVDVPKPGLLGVFGGKEEKCFTIEMPEQTVTASLAGGGKQQYYVLESELMAGSIDINAEKFPTPKNIEELQDNYNLLEIRGLDIYFK